MRSFASIITLLFALVAFAWAADESSYDATVYITSTIYRVNTVTMSGTSPTSSVANQTSTITPTGGYAAPTGAFSTNGTTVRPTGASNPAGPEFTGAASSLNANAVVAALVAGVGYLVL